MFKHDMTHSKCKQYDNGVINYFMFLAKGQKPAFFYVL